MSDLNSTNRMDLHSIFCSIVQPIKTSASIYDPGIFFTSTAYWNFLLQLGKFISLVESTLPIDVDHISSSNSLLKCYAITTDRPIKILRHSLSFLYLVPNVDYEKKHLVFRYGIDIFESAVVSTDETVKIFLRDEVQFSLKRELQASLLRLYNQCAKVFLPPFPVKSEVNSTSSSSQNAHVCHLGTEDKSIEPSFALGTLLPENLFQNSFNFEAVEHLTAAHKSQFEKVVSEISYQINYFCVDPQRSLEELMLQCKLCHEAVSATAAKSHIDDQKHLLNLLARRKDEKPATGSEISAEDWEWLDFDVSSQTYVCTLCGETMENEASSWAIHFKSETHLSKTKIVPTCTSSESEDCVNSCNSNMADEKVSEEQTIKVERTDSPQLFRGISPNLYCDLANNSCVTAAHETVKMSELLNEIKNMTTITDGLQILAIFLCVINALFDDFGTRLFSCCCMGLITFYFYVDDTNKPTAHLSKSPITSSRGSSKNICRTGHPMIEKLNDLTFAQTTFNTYECEWSLDNKYTDKLFPQPIENVQDTKAKLKNFIENSESCLPFIPSDNNLEARKEAAIGNIADNPLQLAVLKMNLPAAPVTDSKYVDNTVENTKGIKSELITSEQDSMCQSSSGSKNTGGASPKCVSPNTRTTKAVVKLNLSSYFKFLKLKDYFTTFSKLPEADKKKLETNSQFIFIEEKGNFSKVFCTACHVFSSINGHMPKTFKTLIQHFKGSRHQENERSYGPVAFFQYNISVMEFYFGKSAFCSLCSLTLHNLSPSDIDSLLDHFESKGHSNLVRQKFAKGTNVKNDCVTVLRG